MSISRSQIPNQIDAFAPGGEVTESVNPPRFTQDNINELRDLLTQAKETTFAQDVDRYKLRLNEFSPKPEKMNIYDIASELGAAILSTPNTGGASAFTALGVGFSKLNDKIENEFLNQKKQNLQIGMQAFQMALEDERTADNFLREKELYNIKEANSLKKFLYLEGPATETTNELLGRDTKLGENDFSQKRDSVDNQNTIAKLLEQGWKIVKEPESVTNVNVNQNEQTDESKEAAKRQSQFQAKLLEEAKAASSVRTQVSQARRNAMDLTENGKYKSRYGAVPALTNPIRNYLSGLGFTNINLDRLAAEDVGNQLGTNFAMATVALTKGAISNREMEMFLQAAPTMARTYAGYMKMLEYMDRIADRTEKFAIDWISHKRKLRAETNPDGSKKYKDADFYDVLDLYAATWHKNNPLYENEDEIKQIIADADKISYARALGIHENYTQGAGSGDAYVDAIDAELENLKRQLENGDITQEYYNQEVRKGNAEKRKILGGG